jgi:hypothetical protein
MEREGHVTQRGQRLINNVGELERERPIVRPRRRGKVCITAYLKI